MRLALASWTTSLQLLFIIAQWSCPVVMWIIKANLLMSTVFQSWIKLLLLRLDWLIWNTWSKFPPLIAVVFWPQTPDEHRVLTGSECLQAAASKSWERIPKNKQSRGWGEHWKTTCFRQVDAHQFSDVIWITVAQGFKLHPKKNLSFLVCVILLDLSTIWNMNSLILLQHLHNVVYICEMTNVCLVQVKTMRQPKCSAEPIT